MGNTKSIKDVLRPENSALRELSDIHDLLEDKSYIEMVLAISEYGFRAFFNDYFIFLIASYPSKTIVNLYWEEAFQIYIHPYYSQLWRGLEKPPKEKKEIS